MFNGHNEKYGYRKFIILFSRDTMEEAQKDMQSAVLDVLNNVDKKCLRPLHVNN